MMQQFDLCLLSRLPPPPRGIQWSPGPAAPPAPLAGRVGWTRFRSGGRSSAWRREPREPTGTASSACWGRDQSLRLQAERTSSEWSSLEKQDGGKDEEMRSFHANQEEYIYLSVNHNRETICVSARESDKQAAVTSQTNTSPDE